MTLEQKIDIIYRLCEKKCNSTEQGGYIKNTTDLGVRTKIYTAGSFLNVLKYELHSIPRRKINKTYSYLLFGVENNKKFPMLKKIFSVISEVSIVGHEINEVQDMYEFSPADTPYEFGKYIVKYGISSNEKHSYLMHIAPTEPLKKRMSKLSEKTLEDMKSRILKWDDYHKNWARPKEKIIKNKARLLEI